MSNVRIYRKIHPSIIEKYLNKEEKYIIYYPSKENIPYEYQNKNITWKTWESLGARNKREIKMLLSWGEGKPVWQAGQTLRHLAPKEFWRLCPNLATQKNR